MQKPIFKSAKHQYNFNHKGYCTFPLLHESEVAEIVDIYNTYIHHHSSAETKFHGTGWIQNPEVRVEVSNRVAPILLSALSRSFTAFKILGCGFLQKETGEDSAVPLHQDWTYVDESRFFSMNIWIALEDVNMNNGAMFVLPYSHNIFSGYLRPSPAYPVPFKNIAGKLTPYCKPVTIKRGECLCFNNALLHGSFPNQSPSKRLVLVTTMLPENAVLLHYYTANSLIPEEVIEYTIDAETFLKMERGLPPGRYLKKASVKTKYTQQSFSRFMCNYIKLHLRNCLT
ncbi:MAG: phytanoyl-CoA dioxygenase family protein [Chitinophagales bacterium]|nr:phytanoyl-CoA dioxygenase family protein [Chitinophagales bacterium]